MKFRKVCCSAAMLLMVVSSVAFADDNDDRRTKVIKPSVPQQPATAVPEPEVYGMMLAGLGIVAFATRRKLKAKAIKD